MPVFERVQQRSRIRGWPCSVSRSKIRDHGLPRRDQRNIPITGGAAAASAQVRIAVPALGHVAQMPRAHAAVRRAVPRARRSLEHADGQRDVRARRRRRGDRVEPRAQRRQEVRETPPTAGRTRGGPRAGRAVCLGTAQRTLGRAVPALPTSRRSTTVSSWLQHPTPPPVLMYFVVRVLLAGRPIDGLTSTEKQELSQLRKENARLREERDILKKAAAWFAQEEEAARTHKEPLRFVRASPAVHSIAATCRALGVSILGYHAWRQRAPSRRSTEDAKLIARDQGHRRDVRRELRRPASPRRAGRRGWSQDRGPPGRAAHAESRHCRYFPAPLRRDHPTRERQRPAPDLVKREFAADGPNQLWVADMTYVPTWAGFIYLAVVLDVWSRRVVGWAIGEADDHRARARRAEHGAAAAQAEGVIHHSDQGSQYTSIAFGERCKKMGVRPSMGTVGDAYDNAMAESFFATPRVRADRPARAGRPRPRRAWRCSPTSRAGTTRAAGTRRSAPVAHQLRKEARCCAA